MPTSARPPPASGLKNVRDQWLSSPTSRKSVTAAVMIAGTRTRRKVDMFPPRKESFYDETAAEGKMLGHAGPRSRARFLLRPRSLAASRAGRGSRERHVRGSPRQDLAAERRLLDRSRGGLCHVRRRRLARDPDAPARSLRDPAARGRPGDLT